jgi:hypothetical protein
MGDKSRQGKEKRKPKKNKKSAQKPIAPAVTTAQKPAAPAGTTAKTPLPPAPK